MHRQTPIRENSEHYVYLDYRGTCTKTKLEIQRKHSDYTINKVSKKQNMNMFLGNAAASVADTVAAFFPRCQTARDL